MKAEPLTFSFLPTFILFWPEYDYVTLPSYTIYFNPVYAIEYPIKISLLTSLCIITAAFHAEI